MPDMMRKTHFLLPEEAAYGFGILLMAIGVACVSASNFGYSMIVAPVYLIFAALDGVLSFGTVEYLFQGALLLLLCLVLRRFCWQYLLSFFTAVLYGYTFDLMRWLVSFVPADTLPARILFFAVGTVSISISGALFVRTYLAPEVYELFVCELSIAYAIPFGRVKLTYDCISCVGSILLSIVLFGFGAFAERSLPALGEAILSGYVLEGIGIGTVVAAVVNGPAISLCGRWLDRHFVRTRNARLAKILSAPPHTSQTSA